MLQRVKKARLKKAVEAATDDPNATDAPLPPYAATTPAHGWSNYNSVYFGPGAAVWSLLEAHAQGIGALTRGTMRLENLHLATIHAFESVHEDEVQWTDVSRILAYVDGTGGKEATNVVAA